MSKRFYITTPIYYVTAKPHLGTLYSTVLADILARWHRMRGYETRFITGTDEHGQKVAAAAAAAGLAPQAYVDSFIAAFEGVWKRYSIDYTYFMRTTSEGHQRAVTYWIEQLMRQGDIYLGSYEGFYCTHCETFVADREHHAKGDQQAPPCPSCNRPTHTVTEKCYFFRLSAYQDRLLEFYKSHPDFIAPRERLHEAVSFVSQGLKDLAISRAKTSVSWGIPFPGDDSQVVYVWADALNNYISAVGYGDPARAAELAAWWPADVHVLGKDIVRFHAVFWPAFLMAAGLGAPRQLLVHGWIQVQGAKMSKSLGNVVDPEVLADKFGVDAVRYYIARHLAVTHDAPFSIEDLTTRMNADLANDLGNLVQRMTAFAAQRGMKELRFDMASCTHDDRALLQAVRDRMTAAHNDYRDLMIHKGLVHVWDAIALINSYIHANAPWKLPADARPERAQEIVATAAYALMLTSGFLWTVMPAATEKIAARFGLALEDLLRIATAGAMEGAVTMCPRTGDSLFPKIQEDDKVVATSEHAQQKAAQAPVAAADAPTISIDTFAQVDLRIGTITNVELVPKSEKLYKLTVDAGLLGVRTICSGVRAHFSSEDLLGKQGLFVANLAPRMMLGIPSQGMMLFAEDASGKLQLIGPGASVPSGAKAR